MMVRSDSLPGVEQTPTPARRQWLTEALADLIESQGAAPFVDGVVWGPEDPAAAGLEAVHPPAAKTPAGGTEPAVTTTAATRDARLSAARATARAFRRERDLTTAGERHLEAHVDVTAVYLGLGAVLANSGAEPRAPGALTLPEVAWLLALQSLSRGEQFSDRLRLLLEPGPREALESALVVASASPLSATELLGLPAPRRFEGPAPVLVVPGDARRLLQMAGAAGGLLVGSIVGLVVGSLMVPVVAALVGGIAGRLLGRRVPLPRCSAPRCRRPVPPGANHCPSCDAPILGETRHHVLR